jgi:TonB family protein
MVDFTLDQEDNNKKKKSFGMSVALHLMLLLLFFLPFLKNEPPKEQEGITVALGFIDQGDGNDNPQTQPEEKVEQVSNEKPSPDNAKKETSPDKSDRNTNVKTEPVKVKDPVTKDDRSDVVIQSSTKKPTKQEELDNLAEKRRREAEENARVEAKRRADAEKREQEELDAKKKQFGTLFGKGQGDTGKSGNQGDPKGDPNSKVLEGLAKGSGRVGGGLSNRGLMSEPSFNDNSQKTGRVVIAICVDKNGNVIDATFTQRGSTTTDSQLVEVARKGALKYKFSATDAESQCGTVTVDFKVK